jgi:hypothetical protein
MTKKGNTNTAKSNRSKNATRKASSRRSTKKAQPKKKKGKAARVFIYALAVAALGGGGFLVYDRVKKRRQSASNVKPENKNSLNNPIIIHNNMLPASNATGNNTPLTVVFNPVSLAKQLYTAAQAKNLGHVLAVLKQIKSVPDYSSVNDYYKKQGFIAKTIVTDLLSYAFQKDESAKAQLKNEFLRMGLKVNASGSWSLQGIRLYKDLITIRETIVTDSQNNKIPVRRNTILGDEVEVSNGMTWFKSIDNSILKVPSQDVKFT